ncbi:hypothetical protein J5X84_28610 [Streptosporangiaceae bacterium NEAU-GS5]|nr:hypothetical protein [Streptosporangiaceae bacterium NEAU-GS5]
MRRIIATLACAASAGLLAPALATPALAQARPADPVAALKKQFVTGHGVKFTERTILTEKGKSSVFVRRSGKFEFAKAGVRSSDITAKFNMTSADRALLPENLQAIFKPERTIRVGTTAYINGGFYGDKLPDGKTWLRFPGGPSGGVTGSFGQIIDIAEPATLKRLVTTATRKGARAYSGTTTIGDLWKISPWFRNIRFGDKPTAAQKKVKIAWQLYVTAKGVPTRIVSKYNGAALEGLSKSETVTVDTHFTGWGGKVSIKAPAADLVAELTDLDLGDS